MRVILPGLMLLLLAASSPSSYAQKRFSNLDRVAEAIEHKLQDKMPDWQHKSVSPASVEENTVNDQVVIQQWTWGKKNLRIAVLQHQSQEEAAEALRQFAADKKNAASLQGLGDEAYAWGIRNSIAFRQDNLTIYMSSVVVEELKGDEGLPDPAEAEKKAAQAEHDEEAKVTRGFAQHVAAALRKL